MSVNILAVTIENGIIYTNPHGQSNSFKDFLLSLNITLKSVIVARVTGWNYSKVYLTQGNEENGKGWTHV